MPRNVSKLECVLHDLSCRYGGADEMVLLVQMALNAKRTQTVSIGEKRRKTNIMKPRLVRMGEVEDDRRQGLRHH